MEKIISKDGTPIAYEHSGAGPPLVLVHGTAKFHPVGFRLMATALAQADTRRSSRKMK